ncbi:tRNA (adenosine(37)-N6)-threonylcarbamoyltransferase complex transferase subunit TsaD [Paenibacillus senegalensis]|uniref:tRNA (adenosine(37)-N6)-threonylcarbamoyltransferase complex transferase subunit TsaD n=1 Tax=Paenibacillus senegalensis TaxID=1465766 RepID=UPI0002897239|nr:tRNA (adenosine(37)-N6)-threonylcarbamoyltransferase complex transferase subunit TsaD [Paenibacillus senegalensis]
MSANRTIEQTNTAAKPCYLLAIETSCDETSAAVVEQGTIIRSNIVSSQMETHRRFGGVVPEVASRKHVETMTRMIEEALAEANVRPDELSAIAVTHGPGLVGSLLVGMVAAKALAVALDLPLIGVHHIAGHIYANQLVQPLQYPLISLVVSGGHTEIVHVEREGCFRILGQTRDDAVGEAFDKVARALQLPYPGGPHIDRLAGEAEQAITLPRAWLEPGSYDFSFSGLKSAVLAALNQAKMKGIPLEAAHVARGFQESAVEVLVEKAIRAANETGAKQLLLAGGVAANRGLRQALTARCEEEGIPLLIPPLDLCTDNAAMIGAAAYLKYTRGQFDSLELKAQALLSLEEWSVG